MVDKIHHVAVAVRSIENSAKFYLEHLGLTVREVKDIPADGVKIAFIPCGETLIELVEPLSESNPVYRFIEKRGEGLHHICFQVNDIRDELKRLNEESVPLLDKEPRLGADGLIAFLHPSATNGMLLELVEQQ